MTPNLRAGKTVNEREITREAINREAYANSLVYCDVVMRAGDGIQFRATGRARGGGESAGVRAGSEAVADFTASGAGWSSRRPSRGTPRVTRATAAAAVVTIHPARRAGDGVRSGTVRISR